MVHWLELFRRQGIRDTIQSKMLISVVSVNIKQKIWSDKTPKHYTFSSEWLFFVNERLKLSRL